MMNRIRTQRKGLLWRAAIGRLETQVAQRRHICHRPKNRKNQKILADEVCFSRAGHVALASGVGNTPKTIFYNRLLVGFQPCRI